MRLKRVWRNTIVLSSSLILIVFAGFVLVKLIPEPPVEKVESARKIISQAESVNSATYSVRLFTDAKALYDSAMKHWQNENKRFIYLRDYNKVEVFADSSAMIAQEAMRTSKINASDLNVKIRIKIDTLTNLVNNFNNLFSSYPLSPDVRTSVSKGKLLLSESKIAYNKADFSQADKKMIESELLLTRSYETALENLKDYFNSFPEWKRWADKTIRDSRQNKNYSIIIDKYSRKCIVYLSGTKRHEFNIELGQNWVGDKRVHGDKATPEGMYKIIRKFGASRTKYYKALLLDYPNEIDKREFRQEISTGTLPKTADIGSLIEIHGEGGRGVDWTEGCIALTNPEMDILYRIAREGTPVTIIGSMIDLDQILK